MGKATDIHTRTDQISIISPNRRDSPTSENGLDDKINRSGCADAYDILEKCMGENDRDWRKCQDKVKAFRECMKSVSVVNVDVQSE